MVVKRILSAVIIAIIGFFLIFSGGWIYSTGIALILASASWEFIHMFTFGDFHPNAWIPALGTFLIILFSSLNNSNTPSLFYVLIIFAILIRSLLIYQTHKKTAAIDLVIELASMVFITFLGSYLIKIRFLPNGLMWIMISILPACAGDIGAYVIGTLFGKHQLSPHLSPHKTIEGYISGFATALITGYGLGLILNTHLIGIPAVSSMIIGGVIGLFSPLGDLSKSIFKRQFNLENTSNLIPGHGGILDRIDSWLWAGPIAYYLIFFLFL
ncbi:MAG: phosphatidate cytidylyltransferase [Anaerolineaceae bacterium]|nr:phosphatidate cytidylyltransferase [Anaerolineaceae bacterium]